ncbi:unnamed protein product [Rotaria magnacalcarata]|uniref:Cytochrome P450 n=1 Tax=Rotaria magnacalcarata TaxID=392030 RepID=A0A820D4H3_9BILA|nr:unnamed protein product [Rotaria magnacalcarata]CAF4218081.1 unnamed protein product [Rotaria magnacalcarata]
MVEITLKLTRKWSSVATVAADQNKSLVFDVHEEIAKLTLDIVTSCVFGTEIMSDEKMHEIVYRTITESLELMEKRLFNIADIIPIINRLPLSSKRRIDKCISEGKQLIRQIVDNRKKGLTKSACSDLLDLLIAASDEDKASKFTDEEVYEEALTFGEYIMSDICSKKPALYNLASNSDFYRRVEAEVALVLNDDEEITSSTLPLLSYTEVVLKEALRIHQPVPAIVRTAAKDNTLDLAILEAKIMFALIIRKFRFELEPGQKLIPEIVVTMRSKYGMRMRIYPR